MFDAADGARPPAPRPCAPWRGCRARNHDFGYNAAPLAIFLGALLVLNAQNH